MALACLSGLLLAGGGVMLAETLTRGFAPAVVDRLRTGLVILGLGLGVWLAASIVHRRKPLGFVTAARSFRWRLLLAGFGTTALLTAAVFAAAAGISGASVLPRRLSGEQAALALASAAFSIAAAAFAEEVALRGWLLQQTAAFTRRISLLIGVNAIAFAALHLSDDWTLAAARAASGAVLAWSVLRLGGLEFAIGAHAARNGVLFAWLAAGGPDADLPASGVLLHILTTLCILLAAEALARRSVVRGP